MTRLWVRPMADNCRDRAPRRSKRTHGFSITQRFPQLDRWKTQMPWALKRSSFRIPLAHIASVLWKRWVAFPGNQTLGKIRWWRRDCCKVGGEWLMLLTLLRTTLTLTVTLKSSDVTTKSDNFTAASPGFCATLAKRHQKGANSPRLKFSIC